MNTFEEKAVWAMRRLIKDLPQLGVLDAAAIMGNGGHESGGLRAVDEVKPTVAGSRGGYHWFQWTGPRRRKLEEFAKKKRLPLNGDEVAYQFLVYELRTSETTAIPKMLAVTTLKQKVEAFEKGYERAGVKHYPSRLKWANRALKAYNEAAKAAAVPVPVPAPSEPAPFDEAAATVLPPTPIASPLPAAPSVSETAAAITAGTGDVMAPINKAVAAGRGAAQSVTAATTAVTGAAAAVSGYTGIFAGINPTYLLLGFGAVLLVTAVVGAAWWTFRKTYRAPPNSPVA